MIRIGRIFLASMLATLSSAGMVPLFDGNASEADEPTPPEQFIFDPISVEAPTATARLTRLGSYRGGWFSNKTPTSAVYDARTERLFLGTVDRLAIEAVDISDPDRPQKVFAISLAPFSGEPNSIAIHKGVLAVALQTSGDQNEPNRILFFNADGDSLASPIDLPGVSRLAFTPDGRKLVATVSGGFDEETLQFAESRIAIIDLGRVNWSACRRGLRDCRIHPNVRLAGFGDFNGQKEDLRRAGVRFFLSAVLSPLLPQGVDLTVGQEVDVAGVSVSQDSRRAYVSLQRNNAIATLDLRKARILRIDALGTRDHSVPGFGMDVSDRDGAIDISNRPLRSFPQPDKIALVRSRCREFIVAVNEGDPVDVELPAGTKLPDGTVLTEDTEFSEIDRVRELLLDGGVFPDAANLQLNENMGRLRVSQIDGFVPGADDNKVFRELITLGSRSLSTFTLEGETLFDTGEDFERITERAALEQGLSFNSAEDENEFDARSDDRGPEPEPLAVGRLYGRTYAFVGSERVGGVFMYDITEPYAPEFQQYINNRNFAVEPVDVCGEKGAPALPSCAEAGDLEVEGIVFIPRRASPIGAPLIAVNHELSDSTTLYRVDAIDRDDDDHDD